LLTGEPTLSENALDADADALDLDGQDCAAVDAEVEADLTPKR